MSVVVDGHALNITSVSYVDKLAFGLTGWRRSVPHLQRLLVHLEESLAELEVAHGLRARRRGCGLTRSAPLVHLT